MHTAIYVRVSTTSQDMKSQEPDLTTWAKAQDQATTWYRDKFTGTVMDRPEASVPIKGVRNRFFDLRIAGIR
jgi:DNA invertase Pin-like site-specific DNA recombinase